MHLLSVILFFSLQINAQKVDYLKIRDGVLQQTCGVVDSSIIMARMERLEALDTNMIGKNLKQYFLDLGLTYWLFANGSKGTEYLEKTILVNRKALQLDPKNETALWNLALAYAMSKDCNQAASYFKLHQHYAPARIRMEIKEEQEAVLKNCRS